MDGGIVLILIVAGIVGLIVLISYFIHKRIKTKKVVTSIELSDWIDDARMKGYTAPQIQVALEEKGWDKKVVERSLEANGLRRIDA